MPTPGATASSIPCISRPPIRYGSEQTAVASICWTCKQVKPSPTPQQTACLPTTSTASCPTTKVIYGSARTRDWHTSPRPHTGNNQYRLPRRTGKRIQLHVLHPPEKRRFHLRKHQRRRTLQPGELHPSSLRSPYTSPLSKSRKNHAKRPKKRRYNSTVC